MVDVVKQAVAKASKPFLDSVSEVLGHEFSAEERLELCRELEAFMVLTITLLRGLPDEGREGHEVVEEALGVTSPALERAVLETAGESGEDFSGKLVPHVQAFFTLASMLMMAMYGQNQKKEE